MWLYLLAGFLFLVILFVLYMLYEAGTISVSYVRIKAKAVYKVVQLSDIHVRLLRADVDEISGIIERESPNALILTGDYIDSELDVPKAIDFIRRVADSCRKANPECFIAACMGNHDYEAFASKRRSLKRKSKVHVTRESGIYAANKAETAYRNKKINFNKMSIFLSEIEGIGVKLLSNKSIIVNTSKGVKVAFTGLDEYRYRRTDVNKALSELATPWEKSENADSEDDYHIKICFSHNPDVSLMLPHSFFDVFLCGHFHGGQIWTPFGLEFRNLRKENLCRKGMVKGLHYINGTNVYISRGLGNVLVPFRFMSKPEVTVLHFGR